VSEALVHASLKNARLILNAIMPQLAFAHLDRRGIRSFSLGDVDGHQIEFSLGREIDVFVGYEEASVDRVVALFASGTEVNEPCLWLQFQQTDVGEIVHFQLHDEYGHLEFGPDDLFEIWSGRLQTLANRIAGFSMPPDPQPSADDRQM
jgi:hypothetical protein